ncbi:uncharacterized protein LOC123656528 [Melitaea cinxia]|uniref:uncharacterized protein LOC123656528 n=1 Tax=Melitaea cinxia TaxID=113334 RepID=UPI001E270BA3|nr:uncharacterized protein LOC123656528 [Melitaea cinxia]
MECRAKNITKLQDILSDKQLEHIVQKVKTGAKIVGYDLQPLTTSDMAGLLGNYFRLTIQVQEDSVKNIHLFIKTLPFNQTKVDTIRQNNFNTREALFYKLIEEMDDSEDPNPWLPKAYIYNENTLVMSDLSKEGYKSHPSTKYFDKNHIMVTAKSVARFHAVFANYVTKKSEYRSKAYNFLDDYGHLMNEPTFLDPRWSQAAAKLTCNYLKEYSANYNKYPAYLEEQLSGLYCKAYNDLKDYQDTLNVIIHRDLWFNNILFRYSGDVAVNAILLDYQSMRVAPPAFDIMLVLHLTTSKRFRECHESEVLHYYYSLFMESLDDNTKQRLASMHYDIDTFLFWCEKARLFAMFYTAGAFPIILMDSVHAQKTLDDPAMLIDLMYKDRSEPVLEHAKENTNYRDKLLDIFEEIVEYALQN